MGKKETKTHSLSEKERFGIEERKPKAKYWFDYKEAHRAVQFIELNLIHQEGDTAGQPFILEGWQRVVVEDVFGWKRKKDNKRRYRVLYIEIPRKNGKSTFGAAIALYLTFADREFGAQIVSAASDREQARIIFDVAKKMVENSSRLDKLAAIFKNSMAYYQYGNTYKVLSSETRGKHGKNLHGIIFDELHEQPNRDLVDTLKSSMGTRSQPLEVYMTTAGYDRTSICYEYHQYAKGVLSGRIKDETFYGVIYAADEKDDWTKKETWEKANPNLGVTVNYEFLERECKIALEVPAYENTFRRLYLNQWTEQENRAIPMHIWEKNNKKFNLEEFEGATCWGGLDLASGKDIAAFVLAFEKEKDVCFVPFLFTPRENMPNRLKKNPLANYPEWAKRGYLIATEGNIIDYDVIKKTILECDRRFNIKRIAYDRWEATQLVTQLDMEGLEMEPFGQGTKSMNAPFVEFLNRLSAERVRHNGHPVLTWMAGNVAAEQDAEGKIKPSKKKSKEKIDGIVAAVMALGMMMTEEGKKQSVYEERGLLAF